MKKKILIAVGVIAAAVLIICAVALKPSEFATDTEDTEELYRSNIATVGYENTIETALPQTELYNMVKSHFESELPEGKLEKKAIIIGYDGCRADVLAEAKDGESAVLSLLNDGGSINLTYCGGVNYPAENTQDTSTAPGWCSVLTGVWADKHGITENGIQKSLEYKSLLTSLVEEGTIGSSSFITKWAGHFSKNASTYILEKEYCEENNINVAFNKCKNDEKSFELALNEIGKTDCADFIFAIYEPTDSTGHNDGFTINNPDYRDAFRLADLYGYETIEAIKARESYNTEDWLIIIASDHGGIGTDHGGGSIQERMTFVVTNK